MCTMLTSFTVSRISCSFTTKNCVFLLAGLWKVSKNEGICARIHFGFKLSKWWLQCRTEFYKMVRNICRIFFFKQVFLHASLTILFFVTFVNLTKRVLFIVKQLELLWYLYFNLIDILFIWSYFCNVCLNSLYVPWRPDVLLYAVVHPSVHMTDDNSSLNKFNKISQNFCTQS